MTIALLTRGFVSKLQKIVNQVPLSPTDAQALLVKELEMLPDNMTSALGIFQADVIIRTAIVAALADMRKNPWLIDYAFASLPKDELTHKDYGAKSVSAAKEWFLKTKVPGVMVPRLNDAQVPCISIHLQSSEESEVTLGDVHYQATEANDSSWPTLTSSFNPVNYSAATGIMVVPQEIQNQLVIVPGMILVDAVGKSHEIIDAFDDGSFSLSQGTVADFKDSVIRPARPAYITHLESVGYRETYQIGCHVGSEPVYLTWLHSLVCFALLRYKQAYLEARGFERSVFSSSDFSRNESFESELVFSRYINLTGSVRQYWPKEVKATITSTSQAVKVIGSGHLPSDTNPKNSLWTGDLDE
jgi:hypothetical protein